MGKWLAIKSYRKKRVNTLLLWNNTGVCLGLCVAYSLLGGELAQW